MRVGAFVFAVAGLVVTAFPAWAGNTVRFSVGAFVISPCELRLNNTPDALGGYHASCASGLMPAVGHTRKALADFTGATAVADKAAVGTVDQVTFTY